MAVLGLAGVLAAAGAQPAAQPVDLWLSAPPVDGDLRACAVDGPARQWRLATGDAQGVAGPRRLSPAAAGRRRGPRRRLGPALLPAARRHAGAAAGRGGAGDVRASPVAAAVGGGPENRDRHVPEMALGCGYPVAGYAPADCGPGLKLPSMP
ncbi:hypothetical protein H1235_04135 [Pseudoxanthomonas sp. NC8]|nr:hypothetical protein H1235_04135 [Pseudoxanthomonas sp. NC8]